MAKRDLNLNSLGRFGKNSEYLVLEEHGHCEVPAGCGGVVLRWRNPNTGLLFLFNFFANGKPTLLIDGTPPESGRPLLSYGSHVIAVSIGEIDDDDVMMALAVTHDESLFEFPRVSRPSNRTIKVLTAADGTWQYSTLKPTSNEWLNPGFADSSWSVMRVRESPALEKHDPRAYRLRAALESGAECLGVVEPTQQIWIRKEFTISGLG